MVSEVITVAVLLRREGQILLVRQQGRDDAYSAWSLPDGVVEPGELLVWALVRVVREETGIEVLRVGDLIHVAQSLRLSEPGWQSGQLSTPDGRVTSFVFEVAEWKGEIGQTDADERMPEARFWPKNDAINHLERHPSRAMREPLLAYLRAEERDRVWLYRPDEEGHDRLEWPSRDVSPEMNEQMKRARAIVVLGCMVILAILIIIVIIGLITLARPFM